MGELPPEGESGLSSRTREQRKRDLPDLLRRLRQPNSIERVTDPALADKYDAKIHAGDDDYYRDKEDRTWCRFSTSAGEPTPTKTGFDSVPRFHLLAALEAELAQNVLRHAQEAGNGRRCLQ